MRGFNCEEDGHLSSPTVTVLMSCYNASRYVREAVESVLAQTYTDFEFVVVDDGSTDDTLDIIRTYAAEDGRIRVIEKANTGLADSLNAGLRRARGCFVARMDADDIALRQRFARQQEFLSAYPSVGVLGTGCTFIDGEGNPNGSECSFDASHTELLRNMLRFRRGAGLIHPTIMMRTEAVRQVGGYNTRISAGQDLDLWLRLSSRTKLQVIPDILLLYRKHSSSISSASRETQLLNGILSRVCYYLQQRGQLDPCTVTDEGWDMFYRESRAIIVRNRLDMADQARIRLAGTVAERSALSQFVALAEAVMREPQLCRAALARHRWRKTLQQVLKWAVDHSTLLSSGSPTFLTPALKEKSLA